MNSLSFFFDNKYRHWDPPYLSGTWWAKKPSRFAFSPLLKALLPPHKQGYKHQINPFLFPPSTTSLQEGAPDPSRRSPPPLGPVRLSDPQSPLPPLFSSPSSLERETFATPLPLPPPPLLSHSLFHVDAPLLLRFFFRESPKERGGRGRIWTARGGGGDEKNRIPNSCQSGRRIDAQGEKEENYFIVFSIPMECLFLLSCFLESHFRCGAKKVLNKR